MNRVDQQLHLEHFGVKGMKWGSRRESREVFEGRIVEARERRDSGAIKADKEAAKLQYQHDRVQMGDRAAKKVLKASKRRLANEKTFADTPLTGKEIAKDLLLTGAIAGVIFGGNYAKYKLAQQ